MHRTHLPLTVWFWAIYLCATDKRGISAVALSGQLCISYESAWYLLKNRDVEFARRSFRIAAAFGLAASFSVIIMGDESGFVAAEKQETKLAAMEAMWTTQEAPASLPSSASRMKKSAPHTWAFTCLT